MVCKRIQLPACRHLGNVGIKKNYSIDDASWLWPKDAPGSAPLFVRFRCAFVSSDGSPFNIHVSGDERYNLYLDGELIARGPDRGDTEHWPFASYEITVDRGSHCLEAEVYVCGDAAPGAQLTVRGGFVLKADGELHTTLTTGIGPWKVERRMGLSVRRSTCGAVFGCGQELVWDCRETRWDNGDWSDPEVIRGPLQSNSWGEAVRGWKLMPATLPEQYRGLHRGGKVVAAGTGWLPDKSFIEERRLDSVLLKSWQAAWDGKASLKVPARTEYHALVYLGTYVCGYPALSFSGGRGSEIEWRWAESLFADQKLKVKEDRAAVFGKLFHGFGDLFIADGGSRTVGPHWWRAGMYCLIQVKTGDTPLVIESLRVLEDRYPLEWEGSFTGDDRDLPAVLDLCVRGMQMCAHETYVDCPYYEQLMYVGDSRLEMLTNYVMQKEDRLPRRGIELFDWSRRNWGFVNERYPTRWAQQSNTFSMIWTLMLHDYLFWRGDREWVRDRMIGLRSMLEHFQPYFNNDNLLENVPGWSFMDWVDSWPSGTPPGGDSGICVTLNLLYALSLERAADLEAEMNEPLLSERHRARAAKVKKAVMAHFWDKKRGLIADTEAKDRFSQHAQSLAILCGAVQGAEAGSLLARALEAKDMALASYYFSHYLFEAMTMLGRGGEIISILDRWKWMVAHGCKTPLESGEPSRSDCHAWSSQPLFHLYASVAGIRPASPGFATVVIRPQPGIWKAIHCVLPHPQGSIKMGWKENGRIIDCLVELPGTVTGELVWHGKNHALRSGGNRLTLPAGH